MRYLVQLSGSLCAARPLLAPGHCSYRHGLSISIGMHTMARTLTQRIFPHRTCISKLILNCQSSAITRRICTLQPIHRTCRSQSQGSWTAKLFRRCGHLQSVVFVRCAGSVAKEAPSRVRVPVSKTDLGRLFALAKPERYRLAGALVLLLVSSSVTMAVPFAIGKIINILNSESSQEAMPQRLRNISYMLLGILVFGALANGARFYLMQTSGQRIIKRMREGLFSSILHQEMAFFDKTKTGELINRLSTDTSLVGQTITMNISDGLRSAAMGVASVSMMVRMKQPENLKQKLGINREFISVNLQLLLLHHHLALYTVATSSVSAWYYATNAVTEMEPS